MEEPTTEAEPVLKPYQRKAGNWISAYLKYVEASESPESYHLWAAMSAIASATRRNVWVDQGLYVLYPNLYIAFIGPPARTAKSTALFLARTILRHIPGVKMGPEAGTRESLIQSMAASKFDNQCALTIHSGEFSDLIDTSGLLMIQFLTSIYDGNYTEPTGWSYETKHQGKDKIINPFLNLIFGTTPTYFAESMPESIVGHGFTSRTIIVYEERERHQNPRPIAMDDELCKALIDDLTHISRLRGPFTWGGEIVGQDSRGEPITAAQKYYDDYYISLFKNEPKDHRLEGFHWRKRTHVLKMAMLISLSERDDRTIEVRDLDTAVQFLHDLEPSMARAFSAVGKNDLATVVERVGSQITAAGGLSVADVYSRNYSSGTSWELEKVVDTLVKMGSVARLVRVDKGKSEEWLMPTNRVIPWALTAKASEAWGSQKVE